MPSLDWPLPIEELREVRDALLARIAPVLRDALAAETPSAQPAAVVSAFFVLEALTLFEAHAITRRLEPMRGGSGRPPGEIRGSVWAGEAPATDPISWRLARGHPWPPAWRRLGRVARGALSRDEFRHGPITPRIARERIISTAGSQFARFHAEVVGEPVTLGRYETWFRPVRTPGEPRRADAQLVEALLEAVRTAFGVGSEDVPGHVEQYLQRFLLDSVALVQGHLDQARSRPGLIPTRLWTGTGGDLWGRLLRTLVQEVGGEVTAHDHATGFGHFRTDLRAFYEFPFCDRYVVFNPHQVQATNAHLRHELLVTPAPSIETARGRPRREVVADSSPGPGSRGVSRRVMYVGPFYTGERLHLYPLPSYPIQVDLEARLLAALREGGHEILLKPHPESVRPPHPFLLSLGKVVEGRFEDVANVADVWLFISATSTAFTNALRMDRPIVLVETKGHLWDPQALELLRRRCAVILTSTGPGGRILVPDGSLEEAVATAPTLRDETFARTYLTYETT